jgi:ABC-2 type transport system permease protein
VSSARLWRYGETIRAGYLDHRTANPWRLNAAVTWPRAILQCYFFVQVGAATDRSRLAFTFVGAVVLTVTLPTMVSIGSVPMADKWMGTFHRIQLGQLPAFTVFALRALPYLLDALVLVALCAVAVGALTGQLVLAVKLLALAPVLVLLVLTSAAAGLAVASAAIRNKADVLLGNTLMYLILAAGGVIVPPGRIPWLDAIGRFLPVRNGLLAVRALLDGRPWTAHLLAEIGVGVAWALLGVLGYRLHIEYARRRGLDAFA